MWQCSYAKEPFDVRLFAIRCIQKWKVVLISTIVGAVLLGGGYYAKNVMLAGKLPYTVINKYYVEYAVDPDEGDRYSYFEAYTFNDWMKSDVYVPEMVNKLSVVMTEEEFITYYQASLAADLRMPYLTVTYPDPQVALEISDLLTEAMIDFASNQKEIDSITRVDVAGPTLEIRDIRTARAFVLGGVLGAFVSAVSLAIMLVLDEKIYVPETFSKRYGIPMVGYVDLDGEVSADVSANLSYLFKECKEIGEIDVANAEGLSDAADTLRAMEGNLLVIHAGETVGKTVESVLDLCGKQDIKVTAAILVDANDTFIRRYRFGRA